MSAQSTQSIAKVLEQMPAGILVVRGLELSVVYANRAVRAALGMRTDPVGQPLGILFPSVHSSTLDMIRHVVRSGRPATLRKLKWPLPGCSESRVTYWDVDCQPIDWSERGLDAVVLMPREVTAHVSREYAALRRAREAESAREALHASERRFRALVENSIEGIVVERVEEGATPLFVNEAAARMLGYERTEEMMALPLLTHVASPQVREAAKTTWERLLRDEVSKFDAEVELIRRDRSRLWANVRGVVVRWDEKPALKITLVDVTARKHAEAQLAERESMLQLALEAADVAAWEYDYATDTLRYSASRDRLYGLRTEGPIRLSKVLERIHPDDRKALVQAYRQAASSGADFLRHEFRGIGADGSMRWMASRARIQRDAAGRALRVLGVDVDVTAERALRERLEQFARTVAHDLRAPLQTIGAFTGLLLRKTGRQLPAEQQGWLEHIVQSVSHMGSLVEGLLAYAAAAHGRVERAPVDLEDVVRELLAILRGAIEAAGARIVHDRLPTVPGNRVLLVQALQNLLSNALKFKADRPLEIRIRAVYEQGMWIISVADNGMGIPVGRQEGLFQTFARVHEELPIPGLGLGLVLVREAVKQHGGKVWMKSVPGVGTTFYLALPDGLKPLPEREPLGASDGGDELGSEP